MHINIFALLLCLTCFYDVDARDWRKWMRLNKEIKSHINQKHTLGIVPRHYNFFTNGVVVSAKQADHFDDTRYGPDQVDPIGGRGFLLKGAPDGKKPGGFITMEIALPKTKSVCGIFFGSRKDAGQDFVDSLKIYWRTDKKMAFRLIADSNTGEFSFKPKFTTNHGFRAIFFDPAPIKYLKLKLYYGANKRPSFRGTVFHTCTYPDTKFISQCGEKIENNFRFASLPYNVPIHIRCPLDCIRMRPCWGFRVYTSDSPICWTATQNFGRKGKGTYTLYKIDEAVRFSHQIIPSKNNKIYCRRYDRRYEAYTFDRKYMDKSIKDYRKKYGA